MIEIIHRILVSSRFYGFDPYSVVERNIVCYDIDSEKIKCCHERIDQTFPGCAYPQFHTADFLMDEIQEKFDFIVGNPPYIRYEKIPANVRSVYKKMFATFYYRADLYVLFFEKLSNFSNLEELMVLFAPIVGSKTNMVKILEDI